ncbi:hypothetical protein [Mycolicibacterium hippocampi]|nr:hypothetical protein [Mycolicibacterium hippocampi]
MIPSRRHEQLEAYDVVMPGSAVFARWASALGMSRLGGVRSVA